jgi:hypothetical protein
MGGCRKFKGPNPRGHCPGAEWGWMSIPDAASRTWTHSFLGIKEALGGFFKGKSKLGV